MNPPRLQVDAQARKLADLAETCPPGRGGAISKEERPLPERHGSTSVFSNALFPHTPRHGGCCGRSKAPTRPGLSQPAASHPRPGTAVSPSGSGHGAPRRDRGCCSQPPGECLPARDMQRRAAATGRPDHRSVPHLQAGRNVALSPPGGRCPAPLKPLNAPVQVLALRSRFVGGCRAPTLKSARVGRPFERSSLAVRPSWPSRDSVLRDIVARG